MAVLHIVFLWGFYCVCTSLLSLSLYIRSQLHEIKIHSLTSNNLNYAFPVFPFSVCFSFLPIPCISSRLEIKPKQEAEFLAC